LTVESNPWPLGAISRRGADARSIDFSSAAADDDDDDDGDEGNEGPLQMPALDRAEWTGESSVTVKRALCSMINICINRYKTDSSVTSAAPKARVMDAMLE